MYLCCYGCIYNICGSDIFVIQMMFSVDILNTKVVDNFLILLFLKFQYFKPADLGVIDFKSLLSAFACALNRSEWLYCLAYLNIESCIGDKRRVVFYLLNCPRTPFLVVANSGYSCSKWNVRFCPNLDRDAFLMLFNLVSCTIILIWY